MRCPKCGAEVKDAARFCLKCGQALASPVPEKRIRVWQRLWWLIPMGIGMLLAAAALLAWLLWLKPLVSDENVVEGAPLEPSPALEDSVGDSELVTTRRVPTDTPVADQSTIEPTTRPTATSSPPAIVLPTATSPPTATPPPAEAVAEMQGHMIYLPLVMRY